MKTFFDKCVAVAKTKNFDDFHPGICHVQYDGRRNFSFFLWAKDPWDKSHTRYASFACGESEDEVLFKLSQIPDRDQRERNFIVKSLGENLEIAKKLNSPLAQAWRAELEASIDRKLLGAPQPKLDVPDDGVPF